MAEYYEVDEKFWSIQLKGKTTVVKYGKIGSNGATSQKDHANAAAAEKFAEKLKREKTNKGYKRKGAPGGSDDEESDEPPKKKAKKAAPKPSPKAKKAAPKKATKKKLPSDDEDEEDEDEPPKKKAKTEAAPAPSGGGGGARIVDRLVPGRENKVVHGEYTIKLNQTNITAGHNNNKYYIIQLLQQGNQYSVWTRWGRVGEDGANNLQQCGANEAAGIKAFEKKFKDKTKNNWSDRDNFTPHSGKYTIVETEEQEGGGNDEPLGKLSKAQIEKGQAVLHEIEPILQGKKNSAKLAELSSKYYTLIPHNFGRQRPPPIESEEKLFAQMELLKFYLRMGFDDMEQKEVASPLEGLENVPLPSTLVEASSKVCSAGEAGKCVFKSKPLEASQAGNPVRKMDKERYGSIFLYTGNAIYRDLNTALRESNIPKCRSYFSYLRLFLDALACLPKQNCTLWRGIGVDLYDQYKVGSTITWWSVSSCTSDINVAKSFMNGCGGKKSLLTVKAKTATDISMITFYSNEKESLVAPGTQLKVLSSKRNGNVAEIELEEVGRVV